MCLQDTEQVCEGMEKLGCDENPKEWPLMNTQIENWGKSLKECEDDDENDVIEQITHLGDSFPVCICSLCLFSLFF